jgi:Tfp pilus assembly protein PilP
MDIENLTIAQAREIAAIFQASEKPNMYSRYVGKYVIVRSSNEGINAGRVKDVDETGIILNDARRIWLWRWLITLGLCKGDFTGCLN